ncbi:hypothetical protein ACJIZ3_019845 [Penstemon smallii]|uniref:Uncharacterized protein n=1 Tax=Penstemon smallii TaxID=265156 RepID=A0ABD3T3K6_9LAMI
MGAVPSWVERKWAVPSRVERKKEKGEVEEWWWHRRGMTFPAEFIIRRKFSTNHNIGRKWVQMSFDLVKAIVYKSFIILFCSC